MSFDGRFIWHELRVPDLDDGARFYGELFGWTTERSATGAIFRAGDVTIGGASAVKPGLANHWTPSIGSVDVDATASLATANGGIVTTGEPADVVGQGRIAPILDPHMTIFAVLAPLPEVALADGGQQAEGRFVWDRLRTPDAAAAARFYEKVLGWTAILDSAGRSGVFQRGDGTKVGELITVAPGEPTGWLPFVLVDALDAARARVTDLGGTIIAEEEEVPAGGGRFAVISDSQGATLAIHEVSRPKVSYVDGP